MKSVKHLSYFYELCFGPEENINLFWLFGFHISKQPIVRIIMFRRSLVDAEDKALSEFILRRR